MMTSIFCMGGGYLSNELMDCLQRTIKKLEDYFV